MLAVVTENATTVFSGLAIILSAAANWRVVRSEKESKKTQRALRKMDILVEIELKNSAVGRLALITVQKLLLLQEHPNLVRDSNREISRLNNNLNLLHKFMEKRNNEEHLAESMNTEDAELHTKSLGYVKRLRLSIEAEVENESEDYNRLLEKV